MLRPYSIFLILFAFVVANAVMMLVLSHFAGPRRPTQIKGTPYESGMPPIGDARERFSVKFYMVAMLFIVFDIEIVFLYPLALRMHALGMFGFAEMAVFIVLLAVAYVYVWRKGALEWR